MEHMKGYDLKRFFPALAWGVSCIFFLLVIFFICSKYGEYRLLCNVGLVDDGIRTSYHASFCECRCLGMPVWYSRYRFGVDVEEVESPSFESGIHG